MWKFRVKASDDQDRVTSVDLNQCDSARGGDPYGRRDGLRQALSGIPSRRDVLRGLAAAGLGLGVATVPELAGAKPKRRRKSRKPRQTPAKPNRYGCLSNNAPCRRASQCCSNVCLGQPGRKRCRAHGTGTCNQTAPAFCESPVPPLTACDNSQACVCMRTTSGSSFCGSTVTSNCAACKRDADCVALGYPPGSACAPFTNGACAGNCPTGMMCMAPCEGFQPPES